MAKFKNREDAGRELAGQLSQWQSFDPVILGIPRGGLPVAASVAQVFKRPFLPLPMRRLQVPWDSKIIFGYVTDQGELHLNQPLIGQVRLTSPEIQKVAKRERSNLLEDLATWGATPFPELENQCALLIDDGMHTGWTLFSSITMVKNLGVRQTFVGVPVTHFRAKRFISHHCDGIVCLQTEELPLYEIGNYYEDFAPVSDEQIRALLKTAPDNPKQSAA